MHRILIFILLTAFSCTNAQKINSSYGYFDKDGRYMELYLTTDTIYICAAEIPIIKKFSFRRENGVLKLYSESNQIGTIELKQEDNDRTQITIQNNEYLGYNIKDTIHLSYYYSNDKKLLDEFVHALLFRQQKFEMQK